MKFTYKHFEEIKHTLSCNEELEQELKNRQGRARERTFDNYDISILIQKVLNIINDLIPKSKRKGLKIIVSPNFSKHYGKKARNRPYIESQLLLIFNDKGFETQIFRTEPQREYYTFRVFNEEQEKLIKDNLFKKFLQNS
jgi:hypothetical protein